MDKKLYDLIDSYGDEFAAMLTRWVQVPSVKDEPATGAPFGTEVRRMLDVAMADAAAMGFKVRGFDGYACDITLGECDEELAVLGHLDVVPAGDGWKVPPFSATRDGDKIIGRGTSDDKGPSLAALFAMKAIKEAGIPLKRSIKMILGCDEESGWEDMAYYAEHAKMPEMGFSPDAAFPLINTEKAMLGMQVTGKAAADGLQILSLSCGERTNVIPGECAALVAGDQATVDAVAAYAARTGLPYDAELTDGGVRLHALGIPGHSAYPEGTRNAIGMMLLLLRELGVTGAVKTLADKVGMEHDGASLGCAWADAESGALTCNMGILRVENGKIFATLDQRVPMTADLDTLFANASSALTGLTVTCTNKKVCHHVPADSELVSQLMAAYNEETGSHAHPESTGGGTYAKVLRQGVAFGACFPEDADLAHVANEYIEIRQMLRAAKIYANALIRLCAE